MSVYAHNAGATPPTARVFCKTCNCPANGDPFIAIHVRAREQAEIMASMACNVCKKVAEQPLVMPCCGTVMCRSCTKLCCPRCNQLLSFLPAVSEALVRAVDRYLRSKSSDDRNSELDARIVEAVDRGDVIRLRALVKMGGSVMANMYQRAEDFMEEAVTGPAACAHMAEALVDLQVRASEAQKVAYMALKK